MHMSTDYIILLPTTGYLNYSVSHVLLLLLINYNIISLFPYRNKIYHSLSLSLCLCLCLCESNGGECLMETGGEKEKRSPTPEEDEEILRKIISGHPLFGLLIENHLGCLKVGLGEFGEVGITTEPDQAADSKPNNIDIVHNPSDIDHFMEAYCMALRKLKEGIEEAQQESESFIKSTYLQLGELTHTNHP